MFRLKKYLKNSAKYKYKMFWIFKFITNYKEIHILNIKRLRAINFKATKQETLRQNLDFKSTKNLTRTVYKNLKITTHFRF